MLDRRGWGRTRVLSQRAAWRTRESVRPMILRAAYGANVSASAVRDVVAGRVEAALFAADEPVTPRRLARLADLADTGEARRQVQRLNQLYARDRSAFYIEELAGGYQMLTRPDLRPWLDRVFDPRDALQLSGPTLETLAIVAYRQPICRADIEAIRGVQVGEILKQLMDKSLVRFAGRDESLGRPYLYGTTRAFLEAFGLRNLHELPLLELFRQPPGGAAKKTPSPSSEPGVDESSVAEASVESDQQNSDAATEDDGMDEDVAAELSGEAPPPDEAAEAPDEET